MNVTYEALERASHSHGDGFWLLDRTIVRANLRCFLEAFRWAGWRDVSLGWSFKTCWIPQVVQVALEEGAFPEVVSRHEVELALAMGAAGHQLIFNGPLKSSEDLERVHSLGGVVHLDAAHEVDAALQIASANPGRLHRVGLRANIDLGLPDRGRFGLDAEAGELQREARRLRRATNIHIEGLHVHISGARRPEQFEARARKLIGLADEIGGGVRYLDLGGGFAGTVPAALRSQMAVPPATVAEYARAIVGAMRERWPSGDGPTLILEPGMALVADAMTFAARVGSVKSIGAKRHAIVGASVYTVKPTLHTLDMPFTVFRPPHRRAEQLSTVVSGYTCMEIDVLSRANLERLDIGDWLLFDNCGAYTFVLNPRFIRGTPAILAADESGWPAVRERDSYESWLTSFG